MSVIRLELTEKQWEIYEEVIKRVDGTAIFLAGLPHEERLDWLKEHQYSYPISFEREIGGTVYAVNAHFSGKTSETVEERVERILNRNTTH